MERFQHFRKRSRANTDVGKFFTIIEQVRILIQDLQNHVYNLKKKQSEILAVPLSNDSRNQQLEEISSKIKSLSNVTRTKLKIIEKGINDTELNFNRPKDRTTVVSIEGDGESFRKRSSTVGPPRYTPAILRIRKTQFSALAQQFTETMQDYHVAQVNYRDNIRARLKRQLELTKNTVSEGEIDDMIDNGKTSLFRKSIIFDTTIPKKDLEDIQSRHNDLLKLEKSIRDLNELFKDLAQQVEFQGEIIDNIEQNVCHTLEFVDAGTVELKSAIDYQDHFRKKKVCLITTGAVVLTLLLLGIVIYLSVTFG